jgi:hypothetical protein
VRTTDNLTEEEAKDMAAAANEDREPPIPGVNVLSPEEYLFFESVEEAESGLDMEIVMPAALPAMNLDGIDGDRMSFGDGVESRTAWLTYSDDAGRQFGITVERNVAPPGTPVTHITEHDMDEGSLGSYTSKSGVEYTTLTESNPDDSSETAVIATVMIGEYEYALVFVGFDEAERHAILDSADLSVYGE